MAIGPVGALNIAARRTACTGISRCLGDGVEHHRVEGALADVAGDQVAQVRLLRLASAGRTGAATASRRAPAEPDPERPPISSRRGVDLDQRDRRLPRQATVPRRARASRGRCGAGAACRRGTTRRCPARHRRRPPPSAARRSGPAWPTGSRCRRRRSTPRRVGRAAWRPSCQRVLTVGRPRLGAVPAPTPLVREWRPDWPCPVAMVLGTHRRGGGRSDLPAYQRRHDLARHPLAGGHGHAEGGAARPATASSGRLPGAAAPSGCSTRCHACWGPTTTRPGSSHRNRCATPGAATGTGGSARPGW